MTEDALGARRSAADIEPGLAGVRLLGLPTFTDGRGSLSVVDGTDHIPFAVRRLYYIYDVPPGEPRAGHAHRNSQNILIPVAGRFEAVVDDGHHRSSFLLDRPDQGLLIPEGIWLRLDRFAAGSVCLALSSQFYADEGYWRDYDEFLAAMGAGC